MLNKLQKNNYVKMLNKWLFWDLNIETLDYKYNRQDIIERIAIYGDENDERIMNIIYPKHVIKYCLKKSDCLNSKTIKYFSFILKIKEEKFKCYMKTHAQRSF
jgi:hypothetical protein